MAMIAPRLRQTIRRSVPFEAINSSAASGFPVFGTPALVNHRYPAIICLSLFVFYSVFFSGFTGERRLMKWKGFLNFKAWLGA